MVSTHTCVQVQRVWCRQLVGCVGGTGPISLTGVPYSRLSNPANTLLP